MSTEYTHIFAYFRQYAQIFYPDVLKDGFYGKIFLEKEKAHGVPCACFRLIKVSRRAATTMQSVLPIRRCFPPVFWCRKFRQRKCCCGF